MPVQNKIKVTKLNPEPTAKGSVLKFDKFIYSKSINSEQGDKPLFLGLDKTIIVRSIVWPFAPLKASGPRLRSDGTYSLMII